MLQPIELHKITLYINIYHVANRQAANVILLYWCCLGIRHRFKFALATRNLKRRSSHMRAYTLNIVFHFILLYVAVAYQITLLNVIFLYFLFWYPFVSLNLSACFIVSMSIAFEVKIGRNPNVLFLFDECVMPHRQSTAFSLKISE